MTRVLVVAGLDPSGGAGLMADLEALAGVGARGWAVAAVLTAQGPAGVRGWSPVPPDLLLAQLDALLDGPGGGRRGRRGDDRPRAIKTGMLGTVELALALCDRLTAPDLAGVPLVLDPVLRSSSGTALFDPGGASPGQALEPLLARARLATPNLPELEALTGLDVSTDQAAAKAARQLPSRAVLVKGGHRDGPPHDLLVERRRVTRLEGVRRPGTARGTGCRLASALAGLLARGATLPEAALGAKRLVERYLDAGG